MYCTHCGVTLDEEDLYCSRCGAATEKAPRPQPGRRLMRSRYDKKIAGVCSGVAEYLEVDVTLVRLIWLTLVFVPPSAGLIAYLIAWIVMPKEPERIPQGHAEPLKA